MEERGITNTIKLTIPGVKEKFLSAIAKGSTYRLACGYAGISYQTYREYMLKAEALIALDLHEEQLENHRDKIYFDFYHDVRRIESYAALKWLEKIDEAANFHWQAAAWKLERRHPNEYGRVVFEAAVNNEEGEITKAKDEVLRLKGDNNGRPKAIENGSSQ